MLSPADKVGGRRGIKRVGHKVMCDGRKSRTKLCGVAANVDANGSCFNGKVEEPGSEG